MRCLHCEISELMLRRQASGEKVNVELLGKVCRVIADIAASQPPDGRQRIFTIAAAFLAAYAPAVVGELYEAGADINDPNGVRARRH